MKYIGIVYTISRAAGKYLKNQISKTLHENNIEFSMITDEQPAADYNEARTLYEIASILFKSIEAMLNKIPHGTNLTIIIAANSVHLAVPELRNIIKAADLNKRLQLISMIDATVEEANSRNFQKITILGSTKTISSQLYNKPLHDFGLKVINVDSKSQKIIDAFIQKGIVNLSEREENDFIGLVIEHIQIHDIDAVIFGCAELGERFNEEKLNCNVINSTDALILSTVRHLKDIGTK